MKYKSIVSLFLAASMLAMTGCEDDFAEINTDPSSISDPNVPYLFTQGILNFEPSDYYMWFYAGKYMARWSQAFLPTDGYRDRFYDMSANGGIGSQNVSVLNIKREIDHYVSSLSQEEAAKYQTIQAMLQPLCIYLGMFDTDMYGSMPYSEASLARYGGTITPKFDTMEELYTQWAIELDAAIKVLSSDLPDQISVVNQDFVYGGDKAKWLKFASAVKLKLAVRLLYQDKAQALKMAGEVGSSAAFVMSGQADDFVYNKGTLNYHFGELANLGAASKNVVDFMLKNRDPRVRFMFTKNQFNSEVIQAFFDMEAEKMAAGVTSSFAVPQYILDNVAYTTDADGKKIFVKWKGLGEPWVRFYGIPVEMDAADKAVYRDEYNYFDESKLQLTIGEATKTYTPYSAFNEEMIHGQLDFTYPTKPGGAVKQDLIDVPWYGMALSTAEVNLYLAEMKLLGASLPESAEVYYETAVRASVEVYDRLARLNKIPYYDEEHIYDVNEKPLQLQAGEIDTMMENVDYLLTGSTAEQLEKVYLQQYLHFMYQPNDQYVAVRRSGVPMAGSELIPWVNLVSNTLIPRRFGVTPPNETDLMYDIKKAAYEAEGFTTGVNNSALLNSERVWADKGAPNFGEGPIF